MAFLASPASQDFVEGIANDIVRQQVVKKDHDSIDSIDARPVTEIAKARR